MPLPNQLGKFNFTSLQPDEQVFMSQLIDAVNSHSGYNGPVTLASHLDLNGNKITNVASPTAESDVLTSAAAEVAYSATALQPKLQAGGSHAMVGYRQIGSGSQREPTSSFLNDLMSTPPNANAIYPVIDNSTDSPDVLVTIPSAPFTFSDGSSILLTGRADILTPPAQYALTSISVAGDLVTAVFSYTGTAPNIAAGNIGTIIGVTPAGYNGTYTLTSVVINTGALTVTVEMQNSAASGSASGGNFQLNGVYYYAAKKRSNSVYLLGAYPGDTAESRLQACFDGYQIVAVVVITASGGQVANSGGGGSAITGTPTAGAFF